MISYNFKGRVAIITGSGKGIGYEIARQLYDSGASVIINDIDGDLVETARKKIDDGSGRCLAVAGDCSEPVVIESMIDTAVKKFDRLDYAICNAGITIFSDFIDFSLVDLKRLLQVNLEGTFLMSQAASRQFIRQGNGGRILLMSSVTGHTAHPQLSAYGMTKAAIEMLAKNLAVELAPYGIHVNAIAPGATLTERNLEDDPEYKEKWEQIIPTGRVGIPSDIANTALFLLADESSHINGQSILVDGGWSSTSPPPD